MKIRLTPIKPIQEVKVKKDQKKDKAQVLEKQIIQPEREIQTIEIPKEQKIQKKIEQPKPKKRSYNKKTTE